MRRLLRVDTCCNFNSARLGHRPDGESIRST
jgi:hypothetical protein